MTSSPTLHRHCINSVCVCALLPVGDVGGMPGTYFVFICSGIEQCSVAMLGCLRSGCIVCRYICRVNEQHCVIDWGHLKSAQIIRCIDMFTYVRNFVLLFGDA